MSTVRVLPGINRRWIRNRNPRRCKAERTSRSARLFLARVAAIRRLAWGDDGLSLPSASPSSALGRKLSSIGRALLVLHPIDMVCNVIEESVFEG